MANPQCENGHIKIANELFEAIISKCKAPESVFLAVMRDTYGFNRKTAEISNKRMCELTKIPMPHINRAINNSVKKGYIGITKNGDRINPTYSIRKNYDKWFESPKLVISPKLVKTITKNGDVPYKDNIKTKGQEKLENEKQKLDELKTAFVWFDVEVWDSFLEYRKKIKATMTVRAEILALKKLDGFKRENQNPIDIINESIINGWKGLFRFKDIKPHEVEDQGVWGKQL